MPTVTNTWSVHSVYTYPNYRECFLPPYDALFALYNGSDAEINISSIYVTMDFGSPNNLTAPTIRTESVLDLKFISDYSGGTVLPWTLLNTASPDLDPNIVFVKYPTNFTVTNHIRQLGPAAQCVDVIASSRAPVAGAYGALTYGAVGASCIYSSGFSSGDYEGITLGEGEGVGIALSSDGGYKTAYLLRVIIKEYGQTDAYLVTTEICELNPGRPMFCIYNGVGSGSIIQIASIQLTPLGSTPQLLTADQYRICKIDYAYSEDEVTPVAFDTSKSLPTGIKAYRSAITSFDNKSKYPYSCVYQDNFSAFSVAASNRILFWQNALRVMYQGHGTTIANAVPIVKRQYNPLWESRGSGTELWNIKSGNGIALFWGSENLQMTGTTQLAEMMYAKANYNFNIIFTTTETTTTPSSGASNFAFL